MIVLIVLCVYVEVYHCDCVDHMMCIVVIVLIVLHLHIEVYL